MANRNLCAETDASAHDQGDPAQAHDASAAGELAVPQGPRVGGFGLAWIVASIICINYNRAEFSCAEYELSPGQKSSLYALRA